MKRLIVLWFVALLPLSMAIPSNFLSHPCTDDEFNCGRQDDTCVPMEWVCDNVADCPSGKDEINCNYLHNCPDRYFMCKCGECIPAVFKCDAFADCSDGTDEIACPGFDYTSNSPAKVPQMINPFVVCARDQFQCEKTNTCIDASKVCDGMGDCPHKEDEEDCIEKPIFTKESDSKSVFQSPTVNAAAKSPKKPETWPDIDYDLPIDKIFDKMTRAAVDSVVNSPNFPEILDKATNMIDHISHAETEEMEQLKNVTMWVEKILKNNPGFRVQGNFSFEIISTSENGQEKKVQVSRKLN